MIDGIATRGFDKLLERMSQLNGNADLAATQAVNKAAERAQTMARRDVQDQVEFPPGYIKGRSGDGKPRLGITKLATRNDMEAVVRGRERPTSLARFARGPQKFGRRSEGDPVKVNVGGSTKAMRSAWLVRLRAGSGEGDSFNVGLAIRLPKGMKLNKRLPAQRLRGGAFLLYGPSVAQVFRDVSRDIESPVSDFVESEFIRNFQRLR